MTDDAPPNALPDPVERMPQMHRYVVGLLRRIPERPAIAPEEAERIEQAHQAHLNKLVHAGEILAFGAFEEEGDLRGLLLFRDGPIERVRGFAAADPAAQHGRLRIELFTWYAPAGLRLGPPPSVEPDDEP